MKISSKNITHFTYFVLSLIAISVGVAYFLSKLLQTHDISLPWYLSLPSIPGIYFFLFTVFDRWLWRNKIVRFISGIKSPNLNGTWAGVGTSSYNDIKFDAELIIEQKATDVTVHGRFADSLSVSLNAGFEPSDIDGCDALFYFFRNEPNPDAPKDMGMHEGSAKLVYDPVSKTIKGTYYSGRDRNNYGLLELEKKL